MMGELKTKETSATPRYVTERIENMLTQKLVRECSQQRYS